MSSDSPTAAAPDAGASGAEATERRAHVLPIKLYLATYGALLVLTMVTVGASLANLGKPAIYVAMAIAVVKASLVVGYFMHLKFDVRFNSLVFFSSLLFLAIFFVLTMIDLGSRGEVLEVQGNFVLREDRASQQRALQGTKRAPARAVKSRWH
jgi:cytochrome c oxidase subunit IV